MDFRVQPEICADAQVSVIMKTGIFSDTEKNDSKRLLADTIKASHAGISSNTGKPF